MRFLLMAVVLLAAAPAYAVDPMVPTWTEVADGVHVGIREPSTRLPVMGNTTIVVGDDGVLVFDGGALPLWSERVVEKVRSLTALPVTHIVVSHWHQDHDWGISAVVNLAESDELGTAAVRITAVGPL